MLTDDGSHSLHSERFGASYHSTHGAIRESEQVFIQNGLHPLISSGKQVLNILEMGFGSGLNALLARLLAPAHPALTFNYLTYERYPIGMEQAAALNFCRQLNCPPGLLRELHAAEWAETRKLEENFNFTKLKEDFLAPAAATPPSADVIFYDAFAPEIQPELWTVEAMEICAARLGSGGLLVTYCAKGQFKRNLRAAGFSVEALPGPKGKREITRASLP